MALRRVVAALQPTAAVVRRAAVVPRIVTARFASSGAGMPESMIKAETEAHAAWLKSVENYPIYEPDFYWTLEFALPPLMELHQFGESPVIVDVQNRDPDADPDDHH